MDSKIFQIFEQAQVSVSSHKTCVKKLLCIAEKSPQDLKTITGCYDKVLSCSKKDPCADRVIKFFSSFIAFQQSDDLLAYFIRYLLERTWCVDKAIRFRSCQTISTVFDVMESEKQDPDFDLNLWQDMRSALLPRLRDKDSTVRTWAVRACKNFQEPTDTKDITIAELVRLMSSDSSKDVRIAACESVLICPYSLDAVVGRTRDVKSEVRAAVISRLGEAIEFTNLSLQQRVEFVKNSLSDRDDGVRAAARAVVLKWLAKMDLDVPKTLRLMGPRSNGTEAELLAWAIIEESQKEGASHSLRSLVMDRNIIAWGPHCTFGDVSCQELLWTICRCSYFHKVLPPAQAYERVEHLLPDTVILCRLLEEGATVCSSFADTSPHLPQAELGLTYLLQLTSFVDSGDVAGNTALIALCQLLLRDVKLSEEVVVAVLQAYSRAHCSRGGGRDTRDSAAEQMVQLAQEVRPAYNVLRQLTVCTCALLTNFCCSSGPAHCNLKKASALRPARRSACLLNCVPCRLSSGLYEIRQEQGLRRGPPVPLRSQTPCCPWCWRPCSSLLRSYDSMRCVAWAFSACPRRLTVRASPALWCR